MTSMLTMENISFLQKKGLAFRGIRQPKLVKVVFNTVSVYVYVWYEFCPFRAADAHTCQQV